MKRFGMMVVTMVLAAALTLTGCNSGGSGAVGNEKVLTIARGADMVSFDVHNHNNTSTEAIHVNMFNYLIKLDENQEPQPDLAESWEQKNDTTWEFKLKENVKFHNGDPFTAEDVKFSLERVAKDQSLLEHTSYKQIKEVKVIDDHTVEIITHNPDPVLLNRLSRLGSSMLPSKYIEEEGWDQFLKQPVGTGPYQFEEWIRDDRVVLKKYDDYFGEKPKWNQVVFRAIPEEATRVGELMTGGVDIVENTPPSDIERINGNEGTHVQEAPTQRVMMLVVRMSEGNVTADPKVREAIELAIDNQAITDNILQGAGTPTRTRVTPGTFGANPKLYDKYEYDPKKAKQLLKEAGFEKGLKLTLSATNGRYLKDKEIAEMIAAMLSEVGIQVKLDMLEWSKYNEKYQGKKFDELYMIGYGNSMFDGGYAFERLSPEVAKGETDYNNAEVEKLLEQAMENMDEKEREQQYQKVQELVAADRPHIYLHQVKGIYGVNDRINFNPRLDELIIADDIELK
ncbi:ABC transporter substrate-binding protein [Desmospora activa]|uniref:Peptide/nickel transport system substrate-binding protein n=1 Tax=Desmospora activa DSM 45169 TaxID=1121389 RepID=A0A2T4ZB21_9BACL|nr:ABC transporter substrate-binding protein [Desmospora activa]PTM59057.1 peptide/nickel transport system substrate-binding protein [Desmospora activa DSM 45169]